VQSNVLVGGLRTLGKAYCCSALTASPLPLLSPNFHKPKVAAWRPQPNRFRPGPGTILPARGGLCPRAAI